jgi:hypothetical protein
MRPDSKKTFPSVSNVASPPPAVGVSSTSAPGVEDVTSATEGWRPWSPAEDARLRAALAVGDAKSASAVLGRSLAAVFHRMRRLGIKKRRRWTRADESTLLLMWGKPIGRIAKELDRTVITVYWRAQKLGLGLGCPNGYEYLSEAARRCGYCTGQLRRILSYARVPLRRAMTRRDSTRDTHIVEPELVDRAVAKWLETEPLEAAARRHGMRGEQLERILRASGTALPPKPGRKRHWRVPSVKVDMAVASLSREAA